MSLYVGLVGLAVIASGLWLVVWPSSYARVMLRDQFMYGRGLTSAQVRGLWAYLAQSHLRLRAAGAVMLLLGLLLVAIALLMR